MKKYEKVRDEIVWKQVRDRAQGVCCVSVGYSLW